MKTPDILKIIQDIRIHLHSGKSISSSIEAAISQSEGSRFAQNLKNWLKRKEIGQNQENTLKHLPELVATPGRRAVISILEQGLIGAPIDEALAELEGEFIFMIENIFERQLQTLPLKLTLPLVLLILPGVMILLAGPLLYSVTRSF